MGTGKHVPPLSATGGKARWMACVSGQSHPSHDKCQGSTPELSLTELLLLLPLRDGVQAKARGQPSEAGDVHTGLDEQLGLLLS